MHVHTRASGDSLATLDDYCRVIRKYRGPHPLDSLVITEHCQYEQNISYQKIGDQYDVLILQGVEAETDLGHLLLYGINAKFLKRIDLSKRNLDSQKVIKTINDCGGIAIPAHPFRNSIYGRAMAKREIDLKEVSIIEELNGSNSEGQNKKATALIEKTGLKGIGGSDAHYANRIWFLTCATQFKNTIDNDEDLVKELRQGHFQAISLDDSAPDDS